MRARALQATARIAARVPDRAAVGGASTSAPPSAPKTGDHVDPPSMRSLPDPEDEYRKERRVGNGVGEEPPRGAGKAPAQRWFGPGAGSGPGGAAAAVDAGEKANATESAGTSAGFAVPASVPPKRGTAAAPGPETAFDVVRLHSAEARAADAAAHNPAPGHGGGVDGRGPLGKRAVGGR